MLPNWREFVEDHGKLPAMELDRRDHAWASIDLNWLRRFLSEHPVDELKALNTCDVEMDPDALTVFSALKDQLTDLGITYVDMFEAVCQDDSLVTRYLGKASENIGGEAAFNRAVWSRGTFVYVPEGVSCAWPLQVFREQAPHSFERLLVVVASGGSLEFVTGCLSAHFDGVPRYAWGVAEYLAEQSSELKLTLLENHQAGPVDDFGRTFVKAGEKATIKWSQARLGKTNFHYCPRVDLMKSSRIEASLIDVSHERDKHYCGLDIQGEGDEEVRFYGVERGGESFYDGSPEPSLMKTYAGDIGEEDFEEMLSGFSLEFAAEVQVALS